MRPENGDAIPWIGFKVNMPDRQCLLVCQDYVREAKAVVSDGEFADVAVRVYAADCDSMRNDCDDFERSISSQDEFRSPILILGGACTAFLRRSPADPKRYRFFPIDQCFEILAGKHMVEHHLKDGAHLLCPGMLRRWKKVAKSWGFEREDAQAFFGESMTHLVLYDSGVDPTSRRLLEEYSEYTGLPFEIVPVGLDYFRLMLAKILREDSSENIRMELQKTKAELRAATTRLADQAMLGDLTGTLASIEDEGGIIDGILDLIVALCAPESVTYLPLFDGNPGEFRPSSPTNPATAMEMMASLRGDFVEHEHGSGFLLNVRWREITVGVLDVHGFAFSEHSDRYLRVLLDIVPVLALAIVNARTEETLRESERRLVQAQKMEVVGQLTGGFAHEFNNLLQAVQSNLELAQMEIVGNRAAEAFLEGALVAGDRGARLTQQLLAFSRKQTLRPEILCVRSLILGMVAPLSQILGEDISIETSFTEDLAKIFVDEKSMRNAILNLARNARAAMPKGGTLCVAANGRHFDVDTQIEDGTLPKGDYVEIAIIDNGCGMSEKVRKRAIEPFFTTRDVGKGSGLGLSMVYGFALQSGGSVSIESDVGLGTRVCLLLPALVEPAAAENMNRTGFPGGSHP